MPDWPHVVWGSLLLAGLAQSRWLAGCGRFAGVMRTVSLSSTLALGLALFSCNNSGRRIGNEGGQDAGAQGDSGQMACPGGPTTLTGKVFAPNGTLPLYNAIVYVPSQEPAPITRGASCEPCDAKVSGSPIVTALTDATGSFTLTNVPAGDKVPLVVQLGKWRRQVTVSVPACTTTHVDADSTRLPRNKNEGDMPQMAIATGGADPFECLLLKIGIDAAEITASGGGGRVTFLLGDHGPGLSMANAQKAHTVTGTPSALLANDIMILPCEGIDWLQEDAPNLVPFLNMGGRVFTTHFSHSWLVYDNSPYKVVAAWNLNMDAAGSGLYPGIIDQSFPKGMAFAKWLHNVSPTINGQFDIVDPHNSVDSVNSMYGQRWIYHPSDNKVEHMTFNTPLNPPVGPDNHPQYCGRAVYSEFHVNTDGADTFKGVFPNACVGYPNLLPMTDQEKALAFMLFDLSSCIEPDGPIG